LVSENVWKKMPQETKELISDAAKKFGQYHRDMVRDEEESMIADNQKCNHKGS
jgi:TRAP-type C4-dicarboxylate transport system substrate-binding protein